MSTMSTRISETTGFDKGDLFECESQVRAYFTPEAQIYMFDDDALTDEDILDEWADEVISSRLHCSDDFETGDSRQWRHDGTEVSMGKITIKYTESDDEIYTKYASEYSAQPAILRLNLETGEVDAYVWGNIGGGIAGRAFNGVDQEWKIPPLTVDGFRRFVDRVSSMLQDVLDGATVEWDGSNHRGTLDDDAQDASDRIHEAIRDIPDSDVYQVWDASDYYEPADALDDLCLNAQSTDEEIAKVASREVDAADVVLDEEDVVDYLTNLRDEALADLVDGATCTVDLDTVETTDARTWQADISVAVTVAIGEETVDETVHVTIGVPTSDIGSAEAAGHVPSSVWSSVPDARSWLGALVDLEQRWPGLDVAGLVLGAISDDLEEIESAVEDGDE